MSTAWNVASGKSPAAQSQFWSNLARVAASGARAVPETTVQPYWGYGGGAGASWMPWDANNFYKNLASQAATQAAQPAAAVPAAVNPLLQALAQKANTSAVLAKQPNQGFEVLSLTKNPALAKAFQGLSDLYSTTQKTAVSDLTGQRNVIAEALKSITGFNDQENSVINNVLGGGLAKTISDMVGTRSKAISNAAKLMTLETEADRKRRQVLGGSGDSSYSQKLKAGAIAKIAADAASADEAQKLQATQWLEQLKQAALGRRAGAETAKVTLSAMPAAASASLVNMLSQGLSGLTNNWLANTFTGVTNPSYTATESDFFKNLLANAVA